MRLRVISLCLLFVIFCGCSGKPESVTVNLRSISFNADIEYYNENFSCNCITDESGNLRINMTAPENLDGLSIAFSGDSCVMDYNGLTVDNAEHFLPENYSLAIIREALRLCDGGICEAKKHRFCYSGELDGIKFDLTVSPTGLPIVLSVPENGLKVNFKNVTIK